MSKVCTKCGIDKPLSEYPKHKLAKDGHLTRCKECVKEYKKEYRLKNSDKLNEKDKKYRLDHPVYLQEYNKKYYKKNSEKIKLAVKKYITDRRKTDLEFRLVMVMRKRMWGSLKAIKKTNRTIPLLGCSSYDLKRHIEKQFTLGMNWDNYGLYGWHIDHIRPCASFNLKNKEEQEACFHYTNLQPLWAKDNYAKGAKYVFETASI